MINADYPFLDFLLNPISPIRPEPIKSNVAGSGTGAPVNETESKPTSGPPVASNEILESGVVQSMTPQNVGVFAARVIESLTLSPIATVLDSLVVIITLTGNK